MADESLNSLQAFIEASKSKGASDEFLSAFLIRRGWAADDVYAAIGNYWERVTGLDIPQRTGAGESSRDAFLYLLSFSTLATWAGALGSMLFQFIDHWIPDAVSRSAALNLRSTITWQMASLAVAFPIYLLVMRLIVREAADHPERLQSGVRKWLTYIALLGTAAAMICDLIWFLDYFLTGELTARFVCKAATVMLICGAIFAYYLRSLRSRPGANSRARVRNIGFAGAACAAVVISFSIGLGVAGTPSQQRRAEADLKRVQDLRTLAFAIKNWHNHHAGTGVSSAIPSTLAELYSRNVAASRAVDPETNVPYEYHPKSASTYELCANFTAEGPGQGFRGPNMPDFWSHPGGRACFALDAAEAVPW